jgi:6-phospho-3-hexuloisomerase
MTPRDYAQKIIQEIQAVLGGLKEEEIERFAQEIVTSDRVFLYGLGRILLMLKAFAMRLVHLQVNAHVIGDVTTPSVRAKNLLILGSASGETESSFLAARKAKDLGARIGLITSNPRSRIARISDFLVEIHAQAKSEVGVAAVSIQPMATLFEQCMLLLFDIAVLVMMENKQMSASDMLSRHFNLE